MLCCLYPATNPRRDCMSSRGKIVYRCSVHLISFAAELQCHSMLYCCLLYVEFIYVKSPVVFRWFLLSVTPTWCCCLQALICLIDKKTNEKSTTRPRFVKQDQIAIVRLEVLGGVICVEPFKDFPQMGRFTLRDEGLQTLRLYLV